MLSVVPPRVADSMNQICDVLRRAMPFQMVSDEMLRDIARLATWRSYARGDLIYDVGDPADGIQVGSSGSVRHVLSVDGVDLDRSMRSGDVFGWAAVLEGRRNRLAKTIALERTELIQINGDELMQLIKRTPA